MVPHIWPHAQCAFKSQTEVVGPTAPQDSGLQGPHGSWRPATLSIEALQSRATPDFWFIDNVELSTWERLLAHSDILPETIVWFTNPSKLVDRTTSNDVQRLRKATEKMDLTSTYWHLSAPDYGSGIAQDRLVVIMSRTS